MTLEQLIRDHKFDYANPSITSENFPELDEGEKHTELFSFDIVMSVEKMLEVIEKAGFELATIYDLLRFAKANFDYQGYVIALGSRLQTDGGIFLPCIGWNGGAWYLDLTFLGSHFYPHYCFLVSRRSSIL